MLEGHDIICVSATAWSENWLSNHQYMSRLAERNRVLYVEKPVSLATVVRRSEGQSGVTQQRRIFRGKLESFHDSLFVATPPAALPLRYERPCIDINQWILRRWLIGVCKKLGFERPILWVYSPDAVLLFGAFGESFRVYSVTDDHASYRGTRNREESIRQWEHRLISKSDIVFATAKNLAEMKRQYNSETFFTPHGVDAGHFASALSPSRPTADELAGLRRPVIGFIGLLNCRIDIALVSEVARRRPDWNLVFIGPMEPEFEPNAFADLSNVRLLGSRDKEALPSYLKGLSVGMIPYLVDKHTHYLHPLKALEYLASGLPVVSTHLPALSAYQPHVRFAANADAFVDAVEQQMLHDSPGKWAERSAFAQDFTWERQLERMSDLIEQRMRSLAKA
jgi:glycosyltransferase involved in cell wall biosynthesis